MVTTLNCLPVFQCFQISKRSHRIICEVSLKDLKVDRQIFDSGLEESNAIITKLLPHLRLILARQRQHIVIHIDADDHAGGSDELRGHITNLAAAAAEVEYHVAIANITRRIAATVITLDNLGRQRLQQICVIFHGAAQVFLAGLRAGGISLSHTGCHIHSSLLITSRPHRNCCPDQPCNQSSVRRRRWGWR